MALDFDELPVYDPIVKDDEKLTPIWVGSLTTLYQTLISYLTQGGILLPNLTTKQRDEIINPQNGQTIYNVTVDAPQFYQSSLGIWRTITFT